MLRSLPRRLAGTLTPEGLERLDAREFVALMLLLLLAAAWLAAYGLRSLADARRYAAYGELRARATSPVPYAAAVPRVAALLGFPGAWTAVVRADSVADPAERERLCALVAASGTETRWLALSADVPPCAAGRLVTPATARDGLAVRAEIGSARWLVIDGEARVRYNRRGVPAASEVGATLRLLAPDPRPPSPVAARSTPPDARGRAL